MAKRFHSEGNYAGVDERRRLEAQDGAMLNEDHSAIANMPQEVKMHPWPDHNTYLPEDLDDTITGINRQVALDSEKLRKGFNPKKV
jgi:hypothetical protein